MTTSGDLCLVPLIGMARDAKLVSQQLKCCNVFKPPAEQDLVQILSRKCRLTCATYDTPGEKKNTAEQIMFLLAHYKSLCTDVFANFFMLY